MGRFYRVPFEDIAVSAAQDLIEIFNHLTPITVGVGAAGAAQGATSIPVDALAAAIPSGTILDFGTTKFAVLTADAAAGATSLTVRAIPTALVDADSAIYTGPSNVMLRLWKAVFTQEESEASEQRVVRLLRRTTRGTNADGTIIPVRTAPGDPAAVFCVQRNIPAANVGTAGDVLERVAENLLNGFRWEYIPEEVVPIRPGHGIALNLPNAPTASIDVSGYALIEEIG